MLLNRKKGFTPLDKSKIEINFLNKMRYRLRNFPLYKRHYQTGFTLIELMIVMAIIAILAVLGIAAIQAARKMSRDTQRADVVRTIQTGLEQWYLTYKSYPQIQTSTGLNAERNYGNCGGIYFFSLFGGTWDNHTNPSNLSQFITNDIMDPRGVVIQDASSTDCTNNENEAYVTRSYRYKYISSDSYAIRVRREVKNSDCGTDPSFSKGTKNSAYQPPCSLSSDPYGDGNSSGSQLFKIE